MTIFDPTLEDPPQREYIAHCIIYPNFGRKPFTEPSETEESYTSIGDTFDKLCLLRNRRVLSSPQNDKNVKILYKTSRYAAMKVKSMPAVDLSPELRAETAEARMDFGNAPPKFIQALGKYLDHKTLLGVRLVCRKWSIYASNSLVFLNRTLFIVNRSLDLLDRCKTQIKWQHVKTHFFLSVETQSVVGYHQKYLVNKLHQDGKKGEQFFILSQVSSLILANVELNTETFVKWLTSISGALKSLEFHSCSIKRSKLKSSNHKNRVQGVGISSFKIKDMSLNNIVELCRLGLLVTKSLKVFEVAVRQTNTKMNLVWKEKFEQELVSLILEVVGVHGKSLESLEISLEPFVASVSETGVLPKFFHRLGSTLFYRLRNFGFRVINPSPGRSVVLDPKVIGFSGAAEVHSTIENICESGRNNLIRICVPFWIINDPQSPGTAFLLSIFPNLSQLGAQFHLNECDSSFSHPEFQDIDIDDWVNLRKMQSQDDNENYKNPLLNRILNPNDESRQVTNVAIFGTISAGPLKRYFPMLKELELEAASVSSTEFQGIIQYFPKLEKLCVGRVKGFEDVALMGVEPELMQILKERSLAGKNMNKTEENHPISRIRKLRILRIRGEMEITDVGIIYSFTGMKDLEVLELSGSILNVSTGGLSFLARNCPLLREVVMDLSKDTVDEAGVTGFLRKLPLLQMNRGKISVG